MISSFSGTDEQDRVEQSLKKDLLKVDHRPVHSSTSTDAPSRCKTASVHRVPRENSPISPSDDFCEPSFVKSVTFFDDPVPEPLETDECLPKFEVFRRPLSSSKSSFYNTIPRPPQTSMFFNQPARSTGMRTPVSRSTRGSTRSGMLTSTALSPRYRSAVRKRVESNHRIKSSTSRTTDSTAKQVTIISGLSIPIENKATRMNSMLTMLTTFLYGKQSIIEPFFLILVLQARLQLHLQQTKTIYFQRMKLANVLFRSHRNAGQLFKVHCQSASSFSFLFQSLRSCFIS